MALLTDDVFMAMPPMPLEFQGRPIVARFFSLVFSADRRITIVSTRANGQPAFGVYLRTPNGAHPGVGVVVLTLSGERVSTMRRFDRSVLSGFGLPSLLDRGQ